MNQRIEVAGLVVLVFFLILFAFKTLLEAGPSIGGFLHAFMYLIPLFVFIAIFLYPVWPGLGMGSVFLTAGLPVFSRNIEWGMAICAILCACFLFVAMMQRKGKKVFNSYDSLFMLVSCAIVCGRFVIDRPGSANLGESGGLGESAMFILGFFSFFLMAKLASTDWDVGRNLKVVVLLALVGLLVQYYQTFSKDVIGGILTLFCRQAWFLLALALSWAFQRYRDRQRMPFRLSAVYLIITAIILISIITPHRSRPLFALGIILGCAYAYEYLRKVMLPLAAASCIIITIFMFSGPNEMPLLISRSLSIVLPVSANRVDEFAKVFNASEERGWQSPFRAELSRLAWYEISRHPFFGKGFAFTRDEILWSLSKPRSLEDVTRKLAVSGMYHNSLVELTVFCGIPATVCFVICFLKGVTMFVRFIPWISDKKMKVFASGLLGFFVATSGQMLMNGGARDFFYICVVLGAMRGIYVRYMSQNVPEVQKDSRVESVPDLAFGLQSQGK